ncbi:MAG: (d)CMP kinase [Candidatus Aenigmatarchaeota archaeon]
MIITISGKAGSGKSSVGKIVAERLGYQHYSIGDLRGKMASDRRISLAEFNKIGEKEDFTDKEVDDYVKKLGETEDNLVVDGRLCFYFIPQSIKVFITANLEKRAQRVFQDERIDEKFKDLEETKKALEEREESDLFRYKKYYNLDHLAEKHYDIIVDSSHITAEQVAEKVIEFIEKNTH